MPRRRWHGLVRLLACALALAIAGTAGARQAAPALRIDFIDVGQGDAALITSPTGKTVLIDGGPRKSARALTAFLSRHVHGPLDLVLLSHRHEDHVGGLPAAIRQVGARQFMDAVEPHESAAYATLMRTLAAQGIPVLQATRGRAIDLGGGARLVLLGPPEPVIHGSRSDVNANSVVVRLTFGGFSALFTGDAEAPTEAWLLGAGVPLQATVLKVPHHGSQYSSGATFLRSVGARIAVVSVGRVNEYGHPSDETLQRLAAAGASVYRTDRDGDVSLETDGSAIQLHTAEGRRQSLPLEGSRR